MLALAWSMILSVEYRNRTDQFDQGSQFHRIESRFTTGEAIRPPSLGTTRGLWNRGSDPRIRPHEVVIPVSSLANPPKELSLSIRGGHQVPTQPEMRDLVVCLSRCPTASFFLGVGHLLRDGGSGGIPSGYAGTAPKRLQPLRGVKTGLPNFQPVR